MSDNNCGYCGVAIDNHRGKACDPDHLKLIIDAVRKERDAGNISIEKVDHLEEKCRQYQSALDARDVAEDKLQEENTRLRGGKIDAEEALCKIRNGLAKVDAADAKQTRIDDCAREFFAALISKSKMTGNSIKMAGKVYGWARDLEAARKG